MDLNDNGSALAEPQLLDSNPPLTTLYMYIAGSCNLACRHCWIEPNYIPSGKNGKFLSLEHAQKAVRQALPLGLSSVKLTGGEPTLHPHFRELVTLLDQAGLEITMECNGTLVDEDLAQFLRATQHFKFVSVSLDGADARTNESLRMVPGSFDRAVQGIRNLVKVGLRPQLICTLHRGNYTQVQAIIELAEALGCSSVKFNRVQSNGRGEQMARDEGLSLPELLEIHQTILDKTINQSKITVIFDIPLAFNPVSSLQNDVLGRCGIFNILGVLSEGELSLCGIGVTTPELIFGQLDVDNLADIWQSTPVLKELRRRIPEELEGVCGECIHRDFCLGTCIANNYHATGRLTSAYYFCSQADEMGLFPNSRRR
jgi:SynChlorMet cassette radical SAM/SPASM protein ScmF